MAATAILIIQLLLLAPIGLAFKGRAGYLRRVSVAFSVGMIALLGINGALSSLPQLQTLPAPKASSAAAIGSVPQEDCERVLEMTDQLGIFGEVEGGRVEAPKRLWDQLPENAQVVLVACLSQRENSGQPLEIIAN